VECPKCGAENNDGASFYGLCSHRFADGAGLSAKAGADGEATLESETTAKASDDSFSAVDSAFYRSKLKQKERRPLWLAGGLVLVIVLVSAVLALVFLRGSGKAGPEGTNTFKSKYSGLTFSYPSSWENMGQAYLKTISKSTDVSPEEGNELVLLKRGDVVFKHLLIVTTAPADYGDQPWEKTKGALEAGYADSAKTQGTAMSFIELQLAPDAGAKGFGMMFTVEPDARGPRQYQLEAFLLKGNIVYTIVLITPLEGGGADQGEAQKQFFDLINTVRVK